MSIVSTVSTIFWDPNIYFDISGLQIIFWNPSVLYIGVLKYRLFFEIPHWLWKLQCVKSAQLAHHLRPIFGLVHKHITIQQKTEVTCMHVGRVIVACYDYNFFGDSISLSLKIGPNLWFRFCNHSWVEVSWLIIIRSEFQPMLTARPQCRLCFLTWHVNLFFWKTRPSMNG